MRRYDSLSMTHKPMCESKEGEWVKYADAKGIIEESFQLGQDSIDIEHMEEIKILRKALDYPADIPLMIQRAIAKEREDCALILEDTKAHNFTLAQLIEWLKIVK